MSVSDALPSVPGPGAGAVVAVEGLLCLVVLAGLVGDPVALWAGAPTPAATPPAAGPAAKPSPWVLKRSREAAADARAFVEGPPAVEAMTLGAVLGLALVGAVSGTFGGMLGMGGGVLKMSCLLLFFGYHPAISRFAALLSYFVVAVGASWRYWQSGYVMGDVVRVLVPSSLAGVAIGVLVGDALPRVALQVLLGGFLLCIAATMGARVLRARSGLRLTDGAGGDGAPEAWKVAVCGFPGGLASAMFGISGGVVTNPLQVIVAEVPIKSAIANTLAKATITVPIACATTLALALWDGHTNVTQPLLVALCLIPGAVVGSQLGPALTRRMAPVTVHVLFGVLTLVLGASMLVHSLQGG